MQIDLWKNRGSTSLDKALNLSESQLLLLWLRANSDITELPRGLNETTRNPACTGRCSTFRLLSLTRISRACGFLQHTPPKYLRLLVDAYFYNKHSLVEIRNRFLDLLGDMFFVVPGLVTAQYHRGESLSILAYSLQGPQPGKAGGCRDPCGLLTDHLLCPSVTSVRGTSQGCPRYNPAHWALQVPCLSGFRNVDQFLFLVFSLLQYYVENSYVPMIFWGQCSRI